LTVKVHPIVYMTIVDAYERRSQKSVTTGRALGTLLGFYEKNVVQVTNCYAIPYREVLDGQQPEISDTFNKEMWQVSKRAAPTESIVGWFLTANDIPNCCQMYHVYYSHLVSELWQKKDQPPVVLLTMDMTFANKDSLAGSVKAYMRGEAGIPGLKSQANIFYPLKVVLDSFPGENVALGAIMKGIDSDRREIHLDEGLDQLEGSTGKMVDRLEQILDYVNKALNSSELPADPKIGRKLMEMVTEASTQLQPEKLEKLVKNSLRDYMMVSYISQLTKTQLSLQEKMLSI